MISQPLGCRKDGVRQECESDCFRGDGFCSLAYWAIAVDKSLGRLGGCCGSFWHWDLSVFGRARVNALLERVAGCCCFLSTPRFFVEQNRILWATLPIKLGIPDNPEVLVLCIAPDR